MKGILGVFTVTHTGWPDQLSLACSLVLTRCRSSVGWLQCHRLATHRCLQAHPCTPSSTLPSRPDGAWQTTSPSRWHAFAEISLTCTFLQSCHNLWGTWGGVTWCACRALEKARRRSPSLLPGHHPIPLQAPCKVPACWAGVPSCPGLPWGWRCRLGLGTRPGSVRWASRAWMSTPVGTRLGLVQAW